MADRRAERRALNENVFREINERLEQLGAESARDTVELVCECADPSCSKSFELPVLVYEAVRDHGRRFVLVPGHEDEQYERVIEQRPDYVIVEKLGEEGDVAEETDPRS